MCVYIYTKSHIYIYNIFTHICNIYIYTHMYMYTFCLCHCLAWISNKMWQQDTLPWVGFFQAHVSFFSPRPQPWLPSLSDLQRSVLVIILLSQFRENLLCPWIWDPSFLQQESPKPFIPALRSVPSTDLSLLFGCKALAAFAVFGIYPSSILRYEYELLQSFLNKI